MAQERIGTETPEWSVDGRHEEGGKTVIAVSTNLDLDSISPEAVGCPDCFSPRERAFTSYVFPADGLDIETQCPGYKCTNCPQSSIPAKVFVGVLTTVRSVLEAEGGQQETIGDLDDQIQAWGKMVN